MLGAIPPLLYTCMNKPCAWSHSGFVSCMHACKRIHVCMRACIHDFFNIHKCVCVWVCVCVGYVWMWMGRFCKPFARKTNDDERAYSTHLVCHVSFTYCINHFSACTLFDSCVNKFAKPAHPHPTASLLCLYCHNTRLDRFVCEQVCKKSFI